MRQDSEIKELQQFLQEHPERRSADKARAVAVRKKGMTYPELARWFGKSPRTIARWVRSYNLHGIDALRDKKPGRPTRLTEEQRAEVRSVIVERLKSIRPRKAWTGRTLAEWIKRRWGVRLDERQCRRIIDAAKASISAK
jgi:transposase